MKGDISATAAIIYTLIALVILVMFASAISPKQQAENTYLGLPGGIDLSISFDEDFKTFIASPAEGKLASLGEKSVIKSWDGKETVQRLMPTAVMYPLVIGSNDVCPHDDSKAPAPFGTATLDININFQKFDDYLRKTYAESFGSEKSDIEPDKVLKKIWIKVCWDNGKSCYDCPEDEAACLSGEGKTLDELKKTACSEVAGSPGLLKCTFKLEKLVEECCPRYLNITTTISAEVKTDKGEGFSRKTTIAPISITPTLIYYASASNKDGLFSGIDKLLGSCFKTPEGEDKNPVEDISIYPCRAIVPNEMSLKELSDKITGPKEEHINFGDCITGSAKEVDGYKLISPEFGWMCKKGSGNTYYILNPYAFCKLDGTKVPSFPQAGYLQSRFPSGSGEIPFTGIMYGEIAWDKAKAEIDKSYGLPN